MQMMSGDGFSIIPSAIDGFAQEHQLNANPSSQKPNPNNPVAKKKRNLPGTPDPDAEVVALSPTTLMATNRFVCEICNKGFQRDQNLQLHRRGHNLPWKLKQRLNKEVKKKVYICPEKSCVHHDPSRALGDLTGIKKHFSRKHGEKKWKCDKCSKKYAVQSDWKAHSKTCGTREYKCDCGTLFSRKDSFITHRAFCDALTEESARLTSSVAGAATNLNFGNETMLNNTMMHNGHAVQDDVSQISQYGQGLIRQDFNGLDHHHHHQHEKPSLSLWLNQQQANSNSHQLNLMDNMAANPNQLYVTSSSSTAFPDMAQMPSANNLNQLFGSPNAMSTFGSSNTNLFGSGSASSSTSTSAANNLSLSSPIQEGGIHKGNSNLVGSGGLSKPPAAPMSATALLQKAAQLGSTRSSNNNNNQGSSSSSSLGVNVMSSSPSSSNTLIRSFSSNMNQNRSNELHQIVQNANQSGGGGANANTSSTLEQLMNNITHRGSSTIGNLDHQNSLTRDFLGMGGGGGAADQLSHNNRPMFSPQELAKFASSMSQFTGNH
ncbi:hypothetical protein CerSpe_222660 [Prunus speciosa]